MHVYGKGAYIVQHPPDGPVEAMKMADADLFPNVRKLLLIEATSPISSLEVEKVASGIRMLKTAFR